MQRVHWTDPKGNASQIRIRSAQNSNKKGDCGQEAELRKGEFEGARLGGEEWDG